MRRRTARTGRARYGPTVLALFLAALLGGSQPGETYPMIDSESPTDPSDAGTDADTEVFFPAEDVATELAVLRETSLWGSAFRFQDFGQDFLQGILTAVRPLATGETTSDSQAVGAGVAQPAGKDHDANADLLTGGPHLFTYEVRTGDTLWTLAQRYGTDVDTLMRINGLKNAHRLKLGQEIRILTVPGLIHTVRRGESVEKIARLYKISPAAVIRANDLDDPDHVRVGQTLILPGAVPPPPPKPAAKQSSSSNAKTSGNAGEASAAPKASASARSEREAVAARGGIPFLIWPVEGPISSYYGPRWGSVHEGIDIAVPARTPVRAAAGGKVIYAGTYGSYGILVIIDHGNGVTTRYAHNSRVEVAAGEVVERGDVIAKSGNTGRSTGPHLHFEVRKQGRPLNPLGYLP
ncbi:MAG: peptidoglycan DD-metalloendopeptidase family protein [Bacteroidota bacterium]